jgi:hypothetical protein
VTVLVQLAIAAVIAGTSPAYDTVFLKNGGRLRGEVIEADPKVSVTIQLPGGERRKLPAAEVLRIEYQDTSVPGAAAPQAEPSTPSPAPDREPGPPAPPVEAAVTPTGPDAAAVEPAATPKGPDAAVKPPGPTALQVTGAVVLAEAMFVFYSAIAAWEPQTAGWVLVGLSPVLGTTVYGEADGKGDANGALIGVAAGLMMAGVGAYNVIELSKDRYSHSDRFWLNMAAWHVGLLGVAAVVGLDQVDGPRKAPASTTPSVSLGLTPGGGALMVAGRF